MANLLAFLCPSVLHAVMFVALGTLVFLSIPTPTVQPIPSAYRFRDYALAKTSQFFANAARFALVVLLPLGIQILELVQTFLSSSLPDSEETAFEEQFKYLIVTSSLLSEFPSLTGTSTTTLSSTHLQHHHHHHSSSRENILTQGLLITFVSTLLLSLIGYQIVPVYMLGILMVTIHGAVYSVLRRYQRRCKIRSIHSTALGLLRDLVIECEQSDAMVMRIIDQSRQLNAIYQGDTLAPPNDISSASSPTTPITASSSRRVADTRRALTHIFNSQWAHWVSALRRLESFSHQGNLSRFRDMYNIIPVAHQQNGSTEEQMHVIHWKRRECLVHLLALDVMTLEHDSDRLDYESHWEVVIKVMGNLVDEYKRHVPTLREHLISSTEVYEDDDERPTRPADPRVNVLLHQYAALEKHVRNIQSKLLLCRQDTRCNQQNQSLERIGDRLSTIEQDITQMLTQWEETTEAYRKLSTASHSLPSPPSSPAGSNNSNKPFMRRSMLTAAAVACFLENKRSREKQPLHSTTPSPPPPPPPPPPSSSSC